MSLAAAGERLTELEDIPLPEAPDISHITLSENK
jgi:hypothetical protein